MTLLCKATQSFFMQFARSIILASLSGHARRRLTPPHSHNQTKNAKLAQKFEGAPCTSKVHVDYGIHEHIGRLKHNHKLHFFPFRAFCFELHISIPTDINYDVDSKFKIQMTGHYSAGLTCRQQFLSVLTKAPFRLEILSCRRHPKDDSLQQCKAP